MFQKSIRNFVLTTSVSEYKEIRMKLLEEEAKKEDEIEDDPQQLYKRTIKLLYVSDKSKENVEELQNHVFLRNEERVHPATSLQLSKIKLSIGDNVHVCDQIDPITGTYVVVRIEPKKKQNLSVQLLLDNLTKVMDRGDFDQLVYIKKLQE